MLRAMSQFIAHYVAKVENGLTSATLCTVLRAVLHRVSEPLISLFFTATPPLPRKLSLYTVN